MKFYRITATLLAPLSIQKTRQSNASETLTYLPGSSLRGALAAKYLREGGKPQDGIFQTLFIRRPVSFPNLLPADDEDSAIGQVLPLTGVSCKRFPGFINRDSHGVGDTLAKKWVDRNNPDEFRDWKCSVCEEDMKPISGYWNGDAKFPAKFQPDIFYQRHTGIDRTTGTIAPEIFYVTQAMADYREKTEEGGLKTDAYSRQILSGGLYMDEEHYELLRPLVKGSLFVGADRTRGMGEIEVAIEPSAPAQLDIAAWDQSFKARLRSISDDALDSDLLSGVYFSIKLESHAILMDEFLRPTPEMDLGFTGLKTVLKVAKSQIIRGWNDAWRMPKPDDMGIKMGSVYLCRYGGGDLEGLKSFLTRLSIMGIGLRREEGFGRVLSCDPFHTQKEVI